MGGTHYNTTTPGGTNCQTNFSNPTLTQNGTADQRDGDKNQHPIKNSTMVKVWYNPPPYGPRTSLNRPAYGTGGDLGPKWVVRLSKMPPGRVITGFIAAFVGLAYIPLSKLRGMDDT